MIVICNVTLIVNCPHPGRHFLYKEWVLNSDHFLRALACWTRGLLLLHLTLLRRHRLTPEGYHVLYVSVVSYVLLLPIASLPVLFTDVVGWFRDKRPSSDGPWFSLWRSVTTLWGCITIFAIWEINGLPILYVTRGPGKGPWCCLWSSFCVYW